MKKSFVFFAGTFVLLMSNSFNSFSQKKLGETVISGDVGISPMGTFASIGANSNASDDVFRAGPVYLGNIDIGITKLMSIGPSFSYQSFRYSYDHSTNAGYIRCTDITTRNTYGGRLLFHFGKSDKESIDFYAGVRVAYKDWGLSSNNPDPTYATTNTYEENQPFAIRVPLKASHDFHFTAQAIYGFRYYFSKYAGFNFEVSIGGPVFFSVGLQAKLF
ncbi:MAG: hypothetical protein ACXVPU_18125 [Bacteroidia bacterium]